MKLEDPTKTWTEYGGLLCPDCRAKMTVIGAAIKARTDEGKNIRVTDILRATRALCGPCLEKVGAAVKHNHGGNQ